MAHNADSMCDLLPLCLGRLLHIDEFSDDDITGAARPRSKMLEMVSKTRLFSCSSLLYVLI